MRNIDGESSLSEEQKYDRIILTYITALISSIDRLERSQIFLRTIPIPREYREAGIYQQDWNEYHHAHYVITLVSLLDTALILTNFVFRLGKREINCKPDAIMKNPWVKKTDVRESLALIKKLITPDVDSRNKHVHRGEVQEMYSVLTSKTEKNLIDAADFFTTAQRCGVQVPDENSPDKIYQLLSESLISQMGKRTKEARIAIAQLFESLLPIYAAKSAELHNE